MAVAYPSGRNYNSKMQSLTNILTPLKGAVAFLRHATDITMARFEDLELWERSARLSAEIYMALADHKDFGFYD